MIENLLGYINVLKYFQQEGTRLLVALFIFLGFLLYIYSNNQSIPTVFYIIVFVCGMIVVLFLLFIYLLIGENYKNFYTNEIDRLQRDRNDVYKKLSKQMTEEYTRHTKFINEIQPKNVISETRQ